MTPMDLERSPAVSKTANESSAALDSSLRWLPQIDTGVPLLDSDHRAMVALINRAAGEAAAGYRESLAITLRELRRISAEHFLRETAVLRSFIKSPDKPEAAPVIRLRLLDGVIAEVESLPPGKVAVEALASVAQRLMDWFLRQTVGQDAKLRAYFQPR